MNIQFTYICLTSFLTLSITACTEQPEINTNYISNPYLNEVNTKIARKKHWPNLASQTNINTLRNAEDQFKITYGYAFGECKGYCKSDIELTSKGVLEIKSGWSNQNQIANFYPIHDTIYQAIIAGIDLKAFSDFNMYLGCGDCSDGGSEWIEIKHRKQRYYKSGGYGFKIPPIQQLLHYLRTL